MAGSIRNSSTGTKNPCPQCHAQELLDKALDADHIKILEYKSRKGLSKLYCNYSKQEFEQRIDNLITNHSSCICSVHQKHEYTWKEVGQIAAERGYKLLGDYKDEDVARMKERLSLLCSKHGVFNPPLKMFIGQETGCPSCGHELVGYIRRIPKSEAQAKIDSVHGAGRYLLGDDYVSMRTVCTIMCTSCGRTRLVIPGDVADGRRCSCETESKGESFTSSFLDYMGLRYEKQVKFDDCRNELPLPFDFKVYNPDGTWFLLEFDGIQHFESVKNWGGEKALKEAQKRDRIKNEFCEKNKIFLIRLQNKKHEFGLSDKERAIKALEKAGDIMAFLSEINKKHSWVITVEI